MVLAQTKFECFQECELCEWECSKYSGEYWKEMWSLGKGFGRVWVEFGWEIWAEFGVIFGGSEFYWVWIVSKLQRYVATVSMFFWIKWKIRFELWLVECGKGMDGMWGEIMSGWSARCEMWGIVNIWHRGSFDDIGCLVSVKWGCSDVQGGGVLG